MKVKITVKASKADPAGSPEMTSDAILQLLDATVDQDTLTLKLAKKGRKATATYETKQV